MTMTRFTCNVTINTYRALNFEHNTCMFRYKLQSCKPQMGAL